MSERAQRRLAAIVSTDVVGYSRLIGADEAGTLARMKAHRAELWSPEIDKHGGRIVGTAGDSLLVEFASAVSAVECSLAVQQGMAGREAGETDDTRMLLRIGVNIGEVVVDGDDIYGDGVNVAARLQAIAPAGGICLSGKVHDEIVGKIAATFEDAGAQEVKNIARPVQVWRWTNGQHPTAPVTAASSSANKPAIAVLPFTNMSDDPEQEYFADGIAEDIITGLSRFRSFLVIARNTTFTYKGKAVDVGQVSRDLKARYVVEGSVRKSGTRVRVTAQLIDGDSGAHIWADRYDGVLEDIFDLQDEVTTAIVSAVAPQSMHAEIERASRRQSTDLGTWDLFMRARWHMGRYNKADAKVALQQFRAIIDRDSRNAEAHAWLALLNVVCAAWGWAEDPGAAMGDAITAARRAAALDGMDALVLAASGLTMALERRFERAVETSERAIRQNPNLALAHGVLAVTLGLSGQYDGACEALEAARRLSPLDPELTIFQSAVSVAAFAAGRYADVLRISEQGISDNPDVPAFHRQMAAALVMLDRTDDARQSIDRLLALVPDYTIRSVRDFFPVPESIMTPLVEALRKAGLPE